MARLRSGHGRTVQLRRISPWFSGPPETPTAMPARASHPAQALVDLTRYP